MNVDASPVCGEFKCEIYRLYVQGAIRLGGTRLQKEASCVASCGRAQSVLDELVVKLKRRQRALPDIWRKSPAGIVRCPSVPGTLPPPSRFPRTRPPEVPPHFVFGIEVPNYDNCIWVRSSRQLNRVREGICKIVYCGGILARPTGKLNVWDRSQGKEEDSRFNDNRNKHSMYKKFT
ncbi:hypothetical protein Bbelb_070670 [Branchiostoma belcheri]|nr:hypothetical protein Bbelb_070670 [Branchiostoma belcheri]